MGVCHVERAGQGYALAVQVLHCSRLEHLRTEQVLCLMACCVAGWTPVWVIGVDETTVHLVRAGMRAGRQPVGQRHQILAGRVTYLMHRCESDCEAFGCLEACYMFLVV